MTRSQENLRAEVERAVRDGVHEVVADSVRAGRWDDAKFVANCRQAITDAVAVRLRQRFRIGRPRRKQTELNP